MMNAGEIQTSFQKVVTESVRLFPEGVNRYLIFTPFHFDDGDHFVIVLRKSKAGTWVITDEGHTYMHMSYHIDMSKLNSGTRNKIIENALEKYGVIEEEGELTATITEIAGAGNILYNFIQCLINIINVSYLSREKVVSTFIEDFRQFITEVVDAKRIEFDYYHKSLDPKKDHKVDYLVNSMSRPVHIYTIKNDAKCRDVTINIWQFQAWKLNFQTLSIFEDQEQINRKVLSRFTNVCDRQFSSLYANRDRIKNHLEQASNK